MLPLFYVLVGLLKLNLVVVDLDLVQTFLNEDKNMNLNDSLKQTSLTSFTNNMIQNTLTKRSKGIVHPSASQSQTIIHPEILFRYNSINLLVSRRGVGKTFTFIKKLIKLSQLPKCGGYTTLLYTTDKTNDETINELIKLIKLKVSTSLIL
jgi:hypothetical protein